MKSTLTFHTPQNNMLQTPESLLPVRSNGRKHWKVCKKWTSQFTGQKYLA